MESKMAEASKLVLKYKRIVANTMEMNAIGSTKILKVKIVLTGFIAVFSNHN